MKADYILKICILGQSGVGKTSLVRRLCYNTFDANTKETIGLDFYSYDLILPIKEKKVLVNLSIWDFGGQERFKNLFRYYITGANGLFLAFDLINGQSLLNLKWWYDKLLEYNHDSVPIILLGTKNDLISQSPLKKSVDEDKIFSTQKNFKIKHFVRTSSKENYNILESFEKLVKEILIFYEL
ncbi:MAG: Rab family GTPase [Promethearchaeota archaeon]